MDEAGVHGHAWIIKDDDAWEARNGATKFNPPKKPTKDPNATVQERLNLADEQRECNPCIHLASEAKKKIVEWFGEKMFVDIHKKGLIPPEKTIKDLMEHLEQTHAQEHVCC